MKKLIISAGILFLISYTLSTNAQSSVADYKIQNKFHLTGDDGWDYLSIDDATNRLFVSHGTMVQVVDLKTGNLVGTIPDTKGVHGIAIAADLNKGFISNGKDSSVTVFDLKTLAFITKVSITGKNPDAILYDQFSHKVFVFNGRSSNVTVIDANSNKVIATISLEGKPEFSVTDGKGNIYVNIEDKSKVCLINSTSLKVEKYWSVSPGEEPSGLAFDKETQRLFSVCNNNLMVVTDAKTGKVITTLPIGSRVDGAAFDPEKKCIYSSNGDGTLTVVKEESADKYTVLGNIATPKGARTIAIDTKTHHVYLPTADFGPAPEATKEHPKPRPSIIPGTFVILDIGQSK